jgi:hypothetical protein
VFGVVDFFCQVSGVWCIQTMKKNRGKSSLFSKFDDFRTFFFGLALAACLFSERAMSNNG